MRKSKREDPQHDHGKGDKHPQKISQRSTTLPRIERMNFIADLTIAQGQLSQEASFIFPKMFLLEPKTFFAQRRAFSHGDRVDELPAVLANRCGATDPIFMNEIMDDMQRGPPRLECDQSLTFDLGTHQKIIPRHALHTPGLRYGHSRSGYSKARILQRL